MLICRRKALEAMLGEIVARTFAKQVTEAAGHVAEAQRLEAVNLANRLCRENVRLEKAARALGGWKEWDASVTLEMIEKAAAEKAKGPARVRDDAPEAI